MAAAANQDHSSASHVCMRCTREDTLRNMRLTLLRADIDGYTARALSMAVLSLQDPSEQPASS